MATAAKNIQILKEVLQKEGLRFTRQRLAVWTEIGISRKHRDADDIYISLRSKGAKVSRATVYRTIDVLVKNKLVRKLDVGDGKNRFESKIDEEHHDHMICLETGNIIEFYNSRLEQLQEKIALDNGYELVRHVHQLFVRPIKK
ncbi:MAG: transcriptional repressor [Candidatus Marinimicrobia bacterium]|jgi:Fe2+ or Zn2+ uptake regulation protein|nr:transcriptional repressor [Candidatus Neomarinimicrobiota bacterium]MDP6614159.1 transcriptional repressor [Candidatus Neomarinimicrobiota bacterium]MDP6820865.1 transcriptional repressor [Candidatus Neomarinimicrobiota bacterium]MED5427285.1 transcriptional repressor [Candidatus Neomarinimicrobiota bacterium]|tara:strand:+ start:3699 stop:4130 length:432 start_codon:yes stop_codon:yes gene_type:complete